jgi:hypothetical protein
MPPVWEACAGGLSFDFDRSKPLAPLPWRSGKPYDLWKLGACPVSRQIAHFLYSTAP